MKAKVEVKISFVLDEGDMDANYAYADEIVDEMVRCARNEADVRADFDIEEM